MNFDKVEACCKLCDELDKAIDKALLANGELEPEALRTAVRLRTWTTELDTSIDHLFTAFVDKKLGPQLCSGDLAATKQSLCLCLVFLRALLTEDMNQVESECRRYMLG